MAPRHALLVGATFALLVAVSTWFAASDGPPEAAVVVASTAVSAPIQHVGLPPVAQVTVESAARETVRASQPRQAVALSATAPGRLRVGDEADLTIAIDASSEASEVTFSVRFDGEVLQVRQGFEGDWATSTGGRAAFEADVSGRDDAIHVRSSVVSTKRQAPGSSSVALVRFQAIAPGTSSMTISDVLVRDRAGRVMPFSLFPTALQVTAESIAP